MAIFESQKMDGGGRMHFGAVPCRFVGYDSSYNDGSSEVLFEWMHTLIDQLHMADSLRAQNIFG